MSDIITKRSEILFCYDIQDANPNGDPLDENKPRIDEETRINIVTDVRLKRTVRDYFFDYKGFNGEKGKDIFVREKELEKGGLQDGKTRAKDFKEDKERILNECIDVRLFGGVIPLDKDSIKFTGPVQFKMGRSLHPVELKHIKGTGAFASEAGKKQATFREEYVLPYSFICFYGIINENAAQHTRLTEDDVKLLMEGLWDGTKNLISRTKVGQMPRLLVKVDYKEPGFFTGDLDSFLKIKCESVEKIRGVEDFTLDMSGLTGILDKSQGKIASIEYRMDSSLKTEPGIPSHWKKLVV
jgi:CRISPR-associated protein Csh2